MKNNSLNLPLLALSVAGLLFGGYFAFEELIVGPAFATNDGLVWTLPLVTYIFLALTSTGVSILVAGGELLGNAAIKAHKSTLLLAALSLLVGAFAALSTEMGSPLHVIWLLLSPNLSSPIWWMGTLYSIELALLAIKLLGGSSARGLTIATLVVALAAAIVLGSVFGTVVARDGFYGIDASLLTLLCAMASGLSLAPLLMSATDRSALLLPGRLLLGLLALLLVVKYVYLARSGLATEVAWVGWWMPVLLLLALIGYQAVPAISALIALPVLLLIELAFVVQGQLQVLGPKQSWLGMVQNYAPNMAEIGILVFGCSVAYLCFYLLSRMLLPARS